MATDPDALARCLTLMDGSPAVCLATVGQPAPRLRALWNLRHDRFPSAAAFCRSQGLVAYFATSMASGKIRDIRSNPAVSLYYCDADGVRGVMLAGRAEIIADDAELKRTLWHESWAIYWPAGAADPDYCVLRVTPREAVGWWDTSSFYFEVPGE